MKTYNIQDIRDLYPCYGPIKYMPEDWSGTLIDILNIEEYSAEGKLWVALNLLRYNEKLLWEFAYKVNPKYTAAAATAYTTATAYAGATNVAVHALGAYTADCTYSTPYAFSNYITFYAAVYAAKAAAYAANTTAYATPYAAACAEKERQFNILKELINET